MAKSIKLVWISLSRSFSGAALPLSGGHVPGALPKRCSVHSPDLEPLLGMGHGGSKLDRIYILVGGQWQAKGNYTTTTNCLFLLFTYRLFKTSNPMIM